MFTNTRFSVVYGTFPRSVRRLDGDQWSASARGRRPSVNFPASEACLSPVASLIDRSSGVVVEWVETVGRSVGLQTSALGTPVITDTRCRPCSSLQYIAPLTDWNVMFVRV